MSGNGDDQGGAKWTDETLSMSQRHELLAQELKRLAPKPRAASSGEHASDDTPAKPADGPKHPG